MTLPSPLLRIAAATALGTCAAAAAAQGSVTLSGVVDAAVRSVSSGEQEKSYSPVSRYSGHSRISILPTRSRRSPSTR